MNEFWELTRSFPVHPFSTPWKGCIGKEWVKCQDYKWFFNKLHKKYVSYSIHRENIQTLASEICKFHHELSVSMSGTS